jgi:mRNA interferase YafQ
MKADIFEPSLSTHKLSGDMLGLRVCTCGYDCRIIFSIEKNKNTGEDNILLIDIGTHDEVY